MMNAFVWLYEACNASISDKTLEAHWNGDNCIENFHLGRYIVGYTLGDNVLCLCSCVSA